MRSKPRVAILHPCVKEPGGAEKYMLSLAKALNRIGFYVHLYFACRINSFNKLGFPSKLVGSSIYGLIPTTIHYSILSEKLKKKYSLIVVSKANETPVAGDICVIHYPLGYALYYWDRIYLGAGVDPKYIKNTLWRIYIQPFRKIFYNLSKSINKCKIVIANSKWTASLLKKLAGVEATVVYPPLLKTLFVESKNSEKSSPLIVTISRFDKSKNLEAIVYAAKRLPNAVFVLAGKASSRASYNYYLYLRRFKEVFELRNLTLIPNISEENKIKLLKKAKIYFHPAIGEHFGLAVVEALASKAIPVVHEQSGACIDIVEKGNYGYCFKNKNEAIQIIEQILNSNIVPPGFYSLEQHLERFTEKNFLEKIRKIISKAISSENN